MFSQEATPTCRMWRLSMAVDGMATRKCGLWLGILVLGSFLPAVLVKFGVGKTLRMEVLFCNL